MQKVDAKSGAVLDLALSGLSRLHQVQVQLGVADEKSAN
jgi:hypothetical protein